MIALLLAQALPATEPRTMDHAKCIVVATKDFEVSGEPATDVATAVVSMCRGLEPRATVTNVAGEMTSEARSRTLDAIRTSIRENVVRYVVEVRACRKKPGCDLKQVAIVKPSQALEYLASEAGTK